MSSAKRNLTQKFVERYKPTSGKDEEIIMDTKVHGLGLRVRASGHKTYVLRYYTASGQSRKHTIGNARQVSLDGARAIALEELGELREGRDPSEERRRARRKREVTMRVLGEETLQFQIESQRSDSYIRDSRTYLEKYILPAVGDRVVTEVEPRELERLVRGLKDKPVAANRLRALLRRMFSLARRWRYRYDDPTAGIEPFEERPRERVLSLEEVKRLCDAMDGSPSRQSRNAALLVLLTGSRPKEVFSAKWEQFDLNAGLWTKPSQHVKQRRTHVVGLSKQALEVLTEMRGDAGPSPFLFPSQSRAGHITSLKTFWKSVTAKAGLEDVKLYDLRRTFATRLLECGTDLATVMKATGHTTAAILLRHYAHSDVLKQRAAVDDLFSVGNQ